MSSAGGSGVAVRRTLSEVILRALTRRRKVTQPASICQAAAAVSRPCQQDAYGLPGGQRTGVTPDEASPWAPWQGRRQKWISMAKGCNDQRGAQTGPGVRHKRHRRRAACRHGCDDRLAAAASDSRHSGRWVKQQRAATDLRRGAACPTGECYAAGHRPFLLGGRICNGCAFCQVEKGQAPVPSMPTRPNGWPIAV